MNYLIFYVEFNNQQMKYVFRDYLRNKKRKFQKQKMYDSYIKHYLS